MNNKPNRLKMPKNIFICETCKREFPLSLKQMRSKRKKRTCSHKCSIVYSRLQVNIYAKKLYQKIKNSPKLKAYQKAYYRSEKNQEKIKERLASPEHIAWLKAYRSTDKYKESVKKRNKTRKFKAYQKKYYNNPERKAKIKAYQEIYQKAYKEKKKALKAEANKNQLIQEEAIKQTTNETQ